MKETIDLLGKILTNILTALYEPFGFSLLLSFLAMFFYLYAYEPEEAGKGWKSAIVTWYQKFKGSVFFRRLFFLAFVTCNQRAQTDGFAEQNGRDAERADLTCRY